MRSIRILFAASLALAPLAAQAEVFNGPRVGVDVGLQKDRLRAAVSVGGVTAADTLSSNGFGYGVNAGYDATLGGRAVVGVEVGASGRTGTIAGPADLGAGTSFKALRTLTASLRAGVLATPDTLLYGRVGYANGRFRYTDPTGSDSASRDGLVLGVGAEHAFTQNVSARIEYDHTNFKTWRADPGPIGADSASLRVPRDEVKLGLGFAF